MTYQACCRGPASPSWRSLPGSLPQDLWAPHAADGGGPAAEPPASSPADAPAGEAADEGRSGQVTPQPLLVPAHGTTYDSTAEVLQYWQDRSERTFWLCRPSAESPSGAMCREVVVRAVLCHRRADSCSQL